MKNKKGFTIVELVIVIAVIAILAAVLIPTFSGVVQKANNSGALQKATSAMKSTLAMSDYGTLSDKTRFVLFSGDGEKAKASFQFKYENNSISQEDVDIANLPAYDTVIIRGTTTGNNTTVSSDDWTKIKAVLNLSLAGNPEKATGEDFWKIKISDEVAEVPATKTKVTSSTTWDGTTQYYTDEACTILATLHKATDVSSYFVEDTSNSQTYVAATGTYDQSKTYYTDNTGTTQVDTSGFFTDTSDVQNLYYISAQGTPAVPAVYLKIFVNTDYPKDLITVTTSNN